MVKVKICGLFREEDIEAVNIEKPDYIGFVFAQSKRRVTPEQALRLRKRLVSGIIPVGVFVNEPESDRQALVRNGVIDVIQTPAHIGEYLLFDGPSPGSGKAFDWRTLHVPEGSRFFVAGGLNCGNVGSAIEILKPYAVDVSSGVETDGLKDAQKIREFIQIVRKC
jgi:phosphoribosylanthranilate isomerase